MPKEAKKTVLLLAYLLCNISTMSSQILNCGHSGVTCILYEGIVSPVVILQYVTSASQNYGPHNTSVNLTYGNLTVFILQGGHARVIVVRRHGPVKSVYPLYRH